MLTMIAKLLRVLNSEADPAQIGLAVLTAAVLKGLWTSLYQSTHWRLQRFHNSLVMGGIVVSHLLFVPLPPPSTSLAIDNQSCLAE